MTSQCEKPFFNPYLLTSNMLKTERGDISVSWEGGMVCKNLSCLRNGFLGGRNNHIEFEVQIVLGLFSIALEGGSKKHLNRNLDPVQETILSGQAEAVSRVKVSLEQFSGSKLDAWNNLPHMGHMENVQELFGMFSLEWCPCTGCHNPQSISIK